MITFPKYEEISNGSLKELHESIKKAIKADKETPNGQDKPYGVNEFPDWKEHAEAIESAMTKKELEFEPIIWE